jgi:hypothetical protein
MNTCAICGKLNEVITLEIEADDGQLQEKYVCKSCWEVITAIVISVFENKLKPLASALDELSTKMANNNKVISEIQGTTSELNDVAFKLEEMLPDNDSSNDEKIITALSSEVLAEQLLSFAKEINLNQDETDSLDRETLRLFWKTKGIQSTFDVSAEIDIKIYQVEKIASDKIANKTTSNFFSASNDELSQELADYAKKQAGQVNGQGVYVNLASYSFWRIKGLSHREHTIEIEQRKDEIKRLAQEIVDKDFHEYRDQRLEAEKKELPKLIQSCVDWACDTGRTSITIKDAKYFLLEKKITILEATERALYLSTNNVLKTRKKAS